MQQARQPYLYNICTNKHEQTDMMWGTNLYDEENYYVDILMGIEKTELPLEKSIDDILNMNKYKCHICNIEVPKPYAIEHNNSTKHRICNKIANIALDRTKEQIQLVLPQPRKIEVMETYFCEPCATVVLNSDKEMHEVTKIHKMSLKHDELLSDLLKIYEDIENVEVDFEIDELELLKQKLEQELRSQTELRNINELTDSKEIQEVLDIENGIDIKAIEQQTSDPTAVENPMENICFQSVKPRNAKLKKRALRKWEKAKKKENSIATENVDTISEIENHEVKKIDKSLIQDYVSDLSEDIDINLECILPINVDNASSVKEQRNTRNNNAASGNVAKKIKAIMTKYFDNSRTIAALNNNTEYECNKNKVDKVKNLEQETTKKKESKVHFNLEAEDKIATVEENNNNIRQEITSKTINENNILIVEEQTQTPNNLAQNITVPDPKKEISEHNKERDKKPKNKNIKSDIKTPPTTSQLTKPKAPTFNLVYYLKDISRRCETKPIHTIEAVTDNVIQITAINRDKFKVLVNNFHSFHVKSNDIYCKVCESSNVRRPEWHIAENEHRVKIMAPIKDLNGIRQLDDIWSHCILCNDRTTNVDFHIQSLHHKNKVIQTLVELGHDSEQEIENVHETKQKKKNSALTDLMIRNNLAMTSKGYLNCIICDVIVDYDIASVTQHINSFYHLGNFDLKTAENKVVNTTGESYYCIACDMQLAKINVVSHCNGKKHSKLLQEFLGKQGQEKNETRDEMFHLSSILQNVKKSVNEQLDNSELICFVCNMVIHSIDEHTDTFDHKKSYLSYLESNKLNEIEPDTFYCIPCNTVIGIDYLMSHCLSKKHRRVLKCSICRKTGHNTDCNDSNSQKHQDNTDGNVCNKQGLQSNTDSNVSNKQGLQGNTDSNVSNKQGLQGNTDSNVSNKQGLQGNTDSNVSNKQGQDNSNVTLVKNTATQSLKRQLFPSQWKMFTT